LYKVSDLIGIPFKDRGRTIAGVDCYGLMLMALNRYGITVPDIDVSCYATKEISDIVKEQKPSWIRVETPEPGDVILMNNDNDHPEVSQHVGVYVGDGRFIHALEKIGVCICKMDSPLWKTRIEGVYRWNK
jgi:cell wall-associated NlpC family hydrolase